MPIPIAVAASSFKLNTTFDFEYLVVNGGQPSYGTVAGAGGEVTRGLVDPSTGTPPLRLASGGSLNIWIGTGSDAIGVRGSSIVAQDPNTYVSIEPVSFEKAGYSAYTEKIGSGTATTTETEPGYLNEAFTMLTTASVGYTGTGGNNFSGNGTATQLTNYFHGAAGAGGNASTVTMYSYKQFYDTHQEGLSSTRRFCYTVVPSFSNTTTAGPGVSNFTGGTVAAGGSGGVRIGRNLFNGHTGGTTYLGTLTSRSDGNINAGANTGGGGSPYITSTTSEFGGQFSNRIEGSGGSGVVQIRYPNTMPLLPKRGSAVYTNFGGYHVYTFNQSTSIVI
jgi:hypothetical protein